MFLAAISADERLQSRADREDPS